MARVHSVVGTAIALAAATPQKTARTTTAAANLAFTDLMGFSLSPAFGEDFDLLYREEEK